jgi:Holliday junction resolvase RusA-like endonuclease
MLALESPVCLVMPSPISTNNLFVNVAGRGRAMSGDYRKWKERAVKVLAAQRPLPKYALPVQITIYVGEKGVGNMDADNTSKAYLDALKAAGVIKDDSRKWVRSCNPVWVPGMAGAVIELKPAPAPPLASAIIQRVPYGLRELLR